MGKADHSKREDFAMEEENMSSVEAEDKGAEREFLVGVQDWQTRIVVKQLAISKGMRARVPERSRSRIALIGKEDDFRAVLKEARVLALFLEKRQLEMLKEFLQERGLEFPEELELALARLEIKTAMAGVGCHRGETPHGG
jgi:hypothetical protein